MNKRPPTVTITLEWNERHKFWDIRAEQTVAGRHSDVALQRARTTAEVDHNALWLLAAVVKVEMESWLF